MSERLDLGPEVHGTGIRTSKKSERRKRVQSIMKGLGSLEVELQERAVAKKAAMDTWSKGGFGGQSLSVPKINLLIVTVSSALRYDRHARCQGRRQVQAPPKKADGRRSRGS